MVRSKHEHGVMKALLRFSQKESGYLVCECGTLCQDKSALHRHKKKCMRADKPEPAYKKAKQLSLL